MLKLLHNCTHLTCQQLLLLSHFSCVRLCVPHRQRPTRLPHPWDSPGKNTGVGYHVFLQCMKVKSESKFTQSCPTLSDPMDYSLPGSSIHGIFQARVLEWVLQTRLKQYVNCEIPDVQAGFRKGRGTRDQIANIHWIIEKARDFQKNIYFCFIDYAIVFDCVDHNKLKNSEEMGILGHLTCLLKNQYGGQEATVRTGHGTTDWFHIGKRVCQGCILSPCLFNLCAEYIMRNAGLEEAQARIKIAGRNLNNLRYADDTTLMA